MQLLHLCFIIKLVNLISGYYVTQNLFTYNQGRKFCMEYCESDIASIHNESQQQLAIQTISASKSLFISTKLTVLIGLHTPYHINNFSWSDGTPFDFGADISGGIYPWATDYSAPDGSHYGGRDEGCGSIWIANPPLPPNYYQYGWDDTSCYDPKRILCNHCDGKLNKYIISPSTNNTYNGGKEKCKSLNTTLSSMHSDRDFKELQFLCKMDVNDIDDNQQGLDCWIGLNDEENENIFIYEDGTRFDFGMNINGGIYPWSNITTLEPDNVDGEQHYVILSKQDKYLLDDVKQFNSHVSGVDDTYSLCNMPSEFCVHSLSVWNIVYGNVDFIGYGNCAMNIVDDGFVILYDKQWYNGNGLLLIDYVYKMDMRSGAISHIQLIQSWCNYYVFGIHLSHIPFVYLKYSNQTNEYSLDEVILPINISISVYYLFSVKITTQTSNELLFEISINNINYISYKHVSNEIYIIHNGYSGYIGIGAENTTINAKSLYISGTPTASTVELENWTHCNWTHIPSSRTTQVPSDNPTPAPTEQPTFQPSSIPTYKPTNNSTNSPTLNPFITSNPTNIPTQYPSMNPSMNPSTNPSMNPSTNPSTNPSKNPSINPSSIAISTTSNPSTAIPTSSKQTTSLPTTDKPTTSNPSVPPITDNPSLPTTPKPKTSISSRSDSTKISPTASSINKSDTTAIIKQGDNLTEQESMFKYVVIIAIILLLVLVILCLCLLLYYVKHTKTKKKQSNNVGNTLELEMRISLTADTKHNDKDTKHEINSKAAEGTDQNDYALPIQLRSDTRNNKKIGENGENEEEYKNNKMEREYGWIEEALKQCDNKEWERYLYNFKKHKMSEHRLIHITDNDNDIWKELIPEIGIRLEFKTLWRNKVNKHKNMSSVASMSSITMGSTAGSIFDNGDV